MTIWIPLACMGGPNNFLYDFDIPGGSDFALHPDDNDPLGYYAGMALILESLSQSTDNESNSLRHEILKAQQEALFKDFKEDTAAELEMRYKSTDTLLLSWFAGDFTRWFAETHGAEVMKIARDKKHRFYLGDEARPVRIIPLKDVYLAALTTKPQKFEAMREALAKLLDPLHVYMSAYADAVKEEGRVKETRQYAEIAKAYAEYLLGIQMEAMGK